MANINIGVINPAQSEKVNMGVPNDVAVGPLVEAMVEQMQLPAKAPNGRPHRYQLNLRQPDSRLSRLDDTQTLKQNGVQEDAVLQLTVEMVAGPEDSDFLLVIVSEFAGSMPVHMTFESKTPVFLVGIQAVKALRLPANDKSEHRIDYRLKL